MSETVIGHRTCASCKGTGKRNGWKCNMCNGKGKVPIYKKKPESE